MAVIQLANVTLGVDVVHMLIEAVPVSVQRASCDGGRAIAQLYEIVVDPFTLRERAIIQLANVIYAVDVVHMLTAAVPVPVQRASCRRGRAIAQLYEIVIGPFTLGERAVIQLANVTLGVDVVHMLTAAQYPSSAPPAAAGAPLLN